MYGERRSMRALRTCGGYDRAASAPDLNTISRGGASLWRRYMQMCLRPMRLHSLRLRGAGRYDPARGGTTEAGDVARECAGCGVRRGIFCADAEGMRIMRAGIRWAPGERGGGAQAVPEDCVWRGGCGGLRHHAVGYVRPGAVFWAGVPPGKSDAGDPAFARLDGQGIAAGKHVLAGSGGGNDAAAGTFAGGSELDGDCVVSERGLPGEDVVPRRICGGVPGSRRDS